jgi:hypothetical protein
MVYDPSTDFVGLWRAILGGVEKAEMPGLDFVVAALGRSGLIRVVFSEIPPTVNQRTTAWFKTAHPSYAAEGALYLWDERLGTYVPATPELFLIYLMAYTNDDLLAIFAVIGAPTDDIGKDGDYAIRLDDPGGIYGPKAGGHWPLEPLPGTSYSQISKFLDWLGNTKGSLVFRNTTHWDLLEPASTNGQILHSGGVGGNPFWAPLTSTDIDNIFGGGLQGDIIYRDNTHWTRLPAATNNFILATHGANANPSWTSLSAIIDAVFGISGGVQGSVLYRDATSWTALGPSTNGYILTTHGAGANPDWSSISAAIDLNFPGAVQGSVIYRGASAWTFLPPSTNGQVLTTHGGAQNPTWNALTSILDANFGGTQGSVLVRTSTGWGALGPGSPGYVLTTHGAGADASWGATSGAAVPGNMYPIGSCIVALDGTALQQAFPGGGYAGLGAIMPFGWPGSGSTTGRFLAYSTPFESNIVPGPTKNDIPGMWMLTSYFGGSRAGYESSGNQWPSIHDYLCTVVRVS